jgi:hypothetical protein
MHLARVNLIFVTHLIRMSSKLRRHKPKTHRQQMKFLLLTIQPIVRLTTLRPNRVGAVYFS